MTIEDTWGGKLGAKYQQIKDFLTFLRYALKALYSVLKIVLTYTANVYRQTTDKLMFKSVISTVR